MDPWTSGQSMVVEPLSLIWLFIYFMAGNLGQLIIVESLSIILFNVTSLLYTDIILFDLIVFVCRIQLYNTKITFSVYYLSKLL